MPTTWEVVFHGEFEPEFDGLLEEVQEELLAQAKLLQQFGPRLGRPHADTLNGSRHANMKELRADTKDQALRIALALHFYCENLLDKCAHCHPALLFRRSDPGHRVGEFVRGRNRSQLNRIG